MDNRTALYAVHREQAAVIVNSSGYSIPLHYGSALGEHQAVRESAGMFDISQIGVIDILGEESEPMLRSVLTNDALKLGDGQGMYTCLCNEHGGVLDHLLVFRTKSDHYRLFIDAARHQKDMNWLEANRLQKVEISVPVDLSHLAIQGPDAVRLATEVLQQIGPSMDLQGLDYFDCVHSGDWFVARTGYTGEDGLEVVLPDYHVVPLWNALREQGVTAAGLAARESLRIEAGFPQYGPDLDEAHSPAESGVASAVDIEDEARDFIGREVIEDHALFGGRTRQIGVILDGQGDLSHGQSVELAGKPIGTLTSATYSPTRALSVAMARVQRTFVGACDINVDSRLLSAHIAPIPFVPHGQARE